MQPFGPSKFYFHFLFFLFGFLAPKWTFWPHWTGVLAEMVGTFLPLKSLSLKHLSLNPKSKEIACSQRTCPHGWYFFASYHFLGHLL